ncbi:hypothetical protein [Bacillus sp. CHD6a]|uniref:hypothetical protein n=1 Tax=Bacillus sp. CHD6a TaxID=1643452 RepID=UPI0006CCA05F|nr:hypothetical protein [Bacillus sp. CHD6a]KPB05199.1 hypothetical protein AAV98_07565 [Bacillus sp. CHD6a]
MESPVNADGATEKVFDFRIFITPLLISANGFAFLGADVSLVGYAQATKKDLDYEILLNTAVDFRKWLRFPREGA